MGSKLRCPKCKKKVSWENNLYKPFCSKVCKLADLYSWLEEEYRIKVLDNAVENSLEIELHNLFKKSQMESKEE